ncbi:MAG: hypothetical protein C4531_03375 [Desulfurivibrio sp.]|nr:MAG: hypothetical protein C4531_03375 [Desulfurivibrio sp.]
MILHPGILALLLGALLVTLLMLYACLIGASVLRRWDRASYSQQQLELERRTYLISTMVNYALGFQALSLLLFVYTVDSLHPLFIGAMCATGTLNANPVGWDVLLVKIPVFFLAWLWVIINHYDLRVEDSPLVRPKYSALFVLLPLVALDGWWQFRYFTGLDPQIITSCCGSLFSQAGDGIASSLAGLPIVPMIWVFYLWLLLVLGLLLPAFRCNSAALRYLLALAALLLLPVGLASVISFISIYIYEMPTHHCPFDLLQGGYHFIGYPLYLALFGTVLCGLVPGLMRLLQLVAPGLEPVFATRERGWLAAALLFLLLLLGLVSWPLLFGPFTLQAYL